MKRSIRWLPILSLLFVLLGCQEEISQKKMSQPVRALQACNPTELARHFKAIQEGVLSFRVSGPLIQFPVNPGDEVKKSQDLAWADIVSFQAGVPPVKTDLSHIYFVASPNGMATSNDVENHGNMKVRQPFLQRIEHSQIEMVANIPENMNNQADHPNMADMTQTDGQPFPKSLDSYRNEDQAGIMAVLKNRIQQEPFNLTATIIFFCAIIHTFLASKFMVIAHAWDHAHKEKIKKGLASRHSVHHGAELFHFLGEVEVVFGLWAIALILAIIFFYDWATAVNYLTTGVNFTEPIFVVVIMILASTRPILKIAELVMAKIARLLGNTLVAWWFSILTLGPILGSFITEPAAMTISALLLGNRFYELEPSNKLKYATLGLLFVNISVGGTLTHFAAPPVLMVAGPWNWDMAHMLGCFGWKAIIGILISNAFYFFLFRSELSQLQEKFARRELKNEIQINIITRQKLEAEIGKIGPAVNTELGVERTIREQIQTLVAKVKNRLESEYLPGLIKKNLDKNIVREVFEQRFDEIRTSKMHELYPGLLPENERPAFIDQEWDRRDDPVPGWVILIHVLFMAWTIITAHHPELFVVGLLFFLGFAEITSPYQNHISLKTPLLVGFFLGGLVTHGGVQGWWIAPVLGSLKEIPLMLSATILTAFNDNAAITYLSTLVPGLTDSLKYAVVAGAVAGGGLTIIANAPNPAGQSILKRYFGDAVSQGGLLKAAIIPTLIMLLCFIVFR